MAKKILNIEKAPRSLAQDFKPKTINQKKCIISMAENVITVIIGISGTGKTTLACGMAASNLCNNKIDKIIISRPMIQCGRHGGGLGFLPGDVMEKFVPYITPVLNELENFLGKDLTKKCLNDKTIEIVPIDLMRGRSFKNSFIIIDESQNTTSEQLDMIVTRIDQGSKMVFTGDLDQIDLPANEKDSFELFINDIKHLGNVGLCKLTHEDIQRHPIVGSIILARNNAKNERKKNARGN